MVTRALVQACTRITAPLLFRRGGDLSIIDPIFDDFELGIGCGVEGVSRDELYRQQERVAWQRRIFFREGYAFGLAAAHAITMRPGNPDARSRGDADFRIMQYTGVGFWNGCAKSFGLDGIPEGAGAWANVADYPRFYPFLIGGRSFAEVIRAKRVTSALLQSFEAEGTPVFTEAAWHGCGRGLWFKAAARPETLAGLLDLHPPATRAMTFGLGVAMTLTQIATPAAVEASILSMPERFRDDLVIGSGIALIAMTFECPREESRVRGLYSGMLRDTFDRAAAANTGIAEDDTWYANFVARLPIAEMAHA